MTGFEESLEPCTVRGDRGRGRADPAVSIFAEAIGRGASSVEMGEEDPCWSRMDEEEGEEVDEDEVDEGERGGGICLAGG